jgi:hypothetical protein
MRCLYCDKRLGWFHSRKRPFCSPAHEGSYLDQESESIARRLLEPYLGDPAPPKPDTAIPVSTLYAENERADVPKSPPGEANTPRFDQSLSRLAGFLFEGVDPRDSSVGNPGKASLAASDYAGEIRRPRTPAWKPERHALSDPTAQLGKSAEDAGGRNRAARRRSRRQSLTIKHDD